jgi:hypothetical protein
MISADGYGGATVRRRIDRPGGPLVAGDILSREDLKAMPVSNLRALIDNNAIEPWPWRPPGELHIVHIGRGLYDVFEGEKLTPEPLSKDEAEALAASRMS